MSRFLTRPTLYPFRAADTGLWTWTVDAPLLFELGPLGSGLVIACEPGFTSDLGSVPLWARWLFNPADPQCARAYLVHDRALRDIPLGLSAQLAAAALYDALVLDGVAPWNRKLQTAGVVLGIAREEW